LPIVYSGNVGMKDYMYEASRVMVNKDESIEYIKDTITSSE
jgi:hypothetical protein